MLAYMDPRETEGNFWSAIRARVKLRIILMGARIVISQDEARKSEDTIAAARKVICCEPKNSMIESISEPSIMEVEDSHIS